MTRRNSDGSRNIYCWQCGEFIAKTFFNIQTALCEICRRVENSEPLTDDSIRMYKGSKMDRVDVSYLAVPESPSALEAVGIKRKSILMGVSSMVAHAMGSFQSGDAGKAARTEAKKSKEIARSKQRGRLFANVSINDEPTPEPKLGSMLDVDAALNPTKPPKVAEVILPRKKGLLERAIEKATKKDKPKNK